MSLQLNIFHLLRAIIPEKVTRTLQIRFNKKAYVFSQRTRLVKIRCQQFICRTSRHKAEEKNDSKNAPLTEDLRLGLKKTYSYDSN